MYQSQHFQVRKNQRGIKDSWIKIVIDYGDIYGDKIIFGQKQVNRILKRKWCSQELKKELLKISDKKGLIIIFHGDTLITVYPINRNIKRIKKAS